MPGGLTLLASANANIPTPAAGKVTIFFSLTDGVPSYKNDAGTVLPLGTTGPTGSIGPMGPAIPFLFDPIQGEDGIPGPPGLAGSSGSSSSTSIIKAANETVTSSTVLQNDNELLFALVANATYIIQGCLLVNGSTAGDIKVAFTVPASAVGQMSFNGNIVAVSGNDQFQRVAVINDFATPDFINFGALGTTASQIMPVMINGAIFTAGSSGTLQLQWAQNASDGTATTVLKGSWMTVTRVS